MHCLFFFCWCSPAGARWSRCSDLRHQPPHLWHHSALLHGLVVVRTRESSGHFQYLLNSFIGQCRLHDLCFPGKVATASVFPVFVYLHVSDHYISIYFWSIFEVINYTGAHDIRWSLFLSCITGICSSPGHCGTASDETSRPHCWSAL